MKYFFNKNYCKKAKYRYHNGGGKEKTAQYYSENKVLKENAKREYGKNRYRNMAEV